MDQLSWPMNIKPYFLAVLGLGSIYAIGKLFQKFDAREQGQGEKPPGIYNEGNTCFVNSLLQCLASLDSLRKSMLVILEVNQPQDIGEKVIRELGHVIQELNQKTQNIQIQTLLSLISQLHSQLINFQQQDAYELYSALLLAFQSTVAKRKRTNLSASAMSFNTEKQFENVFLGFTKSSIICQTCKFQTSMKINPFCDLSLDLMIKQSTLESALQHHQSPERIDDWVCTYCSVQQYISNILRNLGRLKGEDNTKYTPIANKILDFLRKSQHHNLQVAELRQAISSLVKQLALEHLVQIKNIYDTILYYEIGAARRKALKKTQISRFPKILVVHLKQLTINPFTGEQFLLSKRILFPKRLCFKLKNKNKNYILKSLLSHIGDQQMGHYFTFRKGKDEYQWFMLSDSSTSKCYWKDVTNSIPYMLFYEQECEGLKN